MGKRKYTRQLPDRTQTAHLEKVQVEHIADCEDCGIKSVCNRRVCHTFHWRPYRHWRSKCNCGKYYNPVTDAWEHISGYELNLSIFRQCTEEKRLKSTT